MALTFENYDDTNEDGTAPREIHGALRARISPVRNRGQIYIRIWIIICIMLYYVVLLYV